MAKPDGIPKTHGRCCGLGATSHASEDSRWEPFGGWNTSASLGQRKLFLSTWMQRGELQADEANRLVTLGLNFRALDGSLPPTAAPIRGSYSAFYAVVGQQRVSVPTGWTVLREVGSFAILRWDGNAPGATEPHR